MRRQIATKVSIKTYCALFLHSRVLSAMKTNHCKNVHEDKNAKIIAAKKVGLQYSSLSRVVRKPAFCICENKDADQLPVTAKLISAFVFATQIVQSLYFLNLKFQASSHLL